MDYVVTRVAEERRKDLLRDAERSRVQVQCGRLSSNKTWSMKMLPMILLGWIMSLK